MYGLHSCLTSRFFGAFGRLSARRKRADSSLVLGGHSELVDGVRLEVTHDEVKVADRFVVSSRPASGRLGAVFYDVAVQTTSAVIAR